MAGVMIKALLSSTLPPRGAAASSKEENTNDNAEQLDLFR